MKDRRLGRFTVTDLFIRGAVDGEGANLFHGMVVIEAQRTWHLATTEYVAWHPQFAPVKEGDMIPVYEATFGPQDIYPTWKSSSSDIPNGHQ